MKSLNYSKQYPVVLRALRPFAITLVSVTLLASCMVPVKMPIIGGNSAYKKAQHYQQAGAYNQAIEKYQEALTDDKLTENRRSDIEQELGKLKIITAENYYKKATTLSNQNKTQDAIQALKKAVDYAPQNSIYAQALQREQKKFAVIQSKVDASMAKGQQQHQWNTAIRELESYRKYESSFPDIANRINTLKDEAAQYHTNRSEQRLKQKKYTSAYDEIKKASQFSAGQEITRKKNARHHLLMSEVAWKKRKYMKAYEEIQKGLEFEPDHPALKEYQDRFLTEWAGILYNKAVAANNEGDYATAKLHLIELSKFKPGFLNTEEMLDEMQSTMVSSYYDQAQRIIDSDDRAQLGTALAYYLLVKQEHSGLFRDIEDKILQTKKMLKKELEQRISLEFKNRSEEPGASNLVREQILSNIKNSKRIKHITILDRESIDDILREQGLGQGFLDESTAIKVKKIKGIQAGVRGEVIKLSVKETGRDRPSYGSAKYISGTKMVPNPDYSSARQAVSAAQQNVLQAQQSVNDAQQQQNDIMSQQQASPSSSPYGALLSGLGQISTIVQTGELDDAKRDLSSARSRLSNTPQQIKEDIYSDYRYEIYDLTLHGEVVLSFKIINFTTSEIGKVYTTRKEEILRDRYIPGDPGKNVASDPIDFPSVDVFKNNLLNKAINELTDNIIRELNSNSKNYYQLAKRAEEDGITDEAIENYMRYIYSSPNLKDRRVQEANNYIYNQLGIQIIRRRR